jgi:hypothetical protein
MTRTCLILALALLVSACSNKENPLASLPDIRAMHANLVFTCTHEAVYGGACEKAYERRL